MPLDDQLISHSNSGQNEAENSESGSSDSGSEENDSASRAGEMRREQRGEGKGRSVDSEGNIRIGKMAALREKKARMVKELKEKAVKAVVAPAKRGISKLLQSAWVNIIETFGLTVIWIDIHIFLSQVLGKDLFCSLGEEWLPDGAPKNIEIAKKSVGMTEGMAVFGLNLGCLILVLAILSIVSMIVSAVENPLGSIWKIFGDLWHAVAGGK